MRFNPPIVSLSATIQSFIHASLLPFLRASLHCSAEVLEMSCLNGTHKPAYMNKYMHHMYIHLNPDSLAATRLAGCLPFLGRFEHFIPSFESKIVLIALIGAFTFAVLLERWVGPESPLAPESRLEYNTSSTHMSQQPRRRLNWRDEAAVFCLPLLKCIFLPRWMS